MMAIYGLSFLFPKAFVASSFKPKNLKFSLIIFKVFLECVGKVLNVNASLCSIGVNFLMRNDSA